MPIEFDEFVTTHSPALLRLAHVLSGDAQRSEDLLQTTLLAAHRRWRRVSAADNPHAYLRRMLVNAHLDWHRRRSSAEVVSELVDPVGTGQAAPDPASTVADRDELRRLLAQMPPRARTVLVLRYYGDLDDQAIGEAMGITASTVRATAARALASLRTSAARDVEEKR